MNDPNPVRLYEKALLLILKDREGTVAVSNCGYALAGALLSDLFLEDRLASEGKHHVLHVADSNPTGDGLLDECLGLIGAASRPRPAQHWITKLAALRDLRHRIARQLCQRGILREDEGKVLLFFTRKVYPEVDPEPEAALVAELTEAIFTDTDQVSAHTAALVALGSAVGLLNATFPRRELHARKARLEAIASGEVGEAAKAAAAAQSAMIAAAAMAAILPTIIS
ncbi:MAG: GPP34 family phosphoprotein [Planctomycetota bacterium]|nr:GPP34 family phosphoprotein [Planctomycetota bacterium]